jgi:hypothetical protein
VRGVGTELQTSALTAVLSKFAAGVRSGRDDSTRACQRHGRRSGVRDSPRISAARFDGNPLKNSLWARREVRAGLGMRLPGVAPAELMSLRQLSRGMSVGDVAFLEPVGHADV